MAERINNEMMPIDFRTWRPCIASLLSSDTVMQMCIASKAARWGTTRHGGVAQQINNTTMQMCIATLHGYIVTL